MEAGWEDVRAFLPSGVEGPLPPTEKEARSLMCPRPLTSYSNLGSPGLRPHGAIVPQQQAVSSRLTMADTALGIASKQQPLETAGDSRSMGRKQIEASAERRQRQATETSGGQRHAATPPGQSRLRAELFSHCSDTVQRRTTSASMAAGGRPRSNPSWRSEKIGRH